MRISDWSSDVCSSDLVADRRFRQLRVFAQRERDVLEYRQIGQQRAILEQQAHALAHCVQSTLTLLVDVMAVELDGARARSPLPADDAQQRGLAGAGWAHDGGDLAARDVDVDPVVDLALALTEMQATHAYQRGAVGGD